MFMLIKKKKNLMISVIGIIMLRICVDFELLYWASSFSSFNVKGEESIYASQFYKFHWYSICLSLE